MNHRLQTMRAAAARAGRRICLRLGWLRKSPVLWALATTLAASPVHAARWALVVGVDTHTHSPRPGTAHANAARVAAALRTAGYQVRELADPAGPALREALSGLSASTAAGDEVIVYFAGLIAETQNDAYLLARDTPIDTEPRLRLLGQSVQAMLSTLALRRPRTALLVVDGSRPPLVLPDTGKPVRIGTPWTPELEPGQAILMATPTDRAATKPAAGAVTDPDGLLAHDLIATLRIRVLPISRFVESFVGAAQQPRSANSPRGTRGVLKDQLGAEYELLGQAQAPATVTAPDEPAARRTISEAMRANVGPLDRRTAYRTALRVSPDHLPALIGMGMLAEADANWLLAINYFERVALVAKAGSLATTAAEEVRLLRRRLEAEVNPKLLRRLEYDAAIAQARLLLAMSDMPGSLGMVERALALDASRWESYAVAGMIAITLDRMQDARQWLREAYARAPSAEREHIAQLGRRL
jgi:Caspase domain